MPISLKLLLLAEIDFETKIKAPTAIFTRQVLIVLCEFRAFAGRSCDQPANLGLFVICLSKVYGPMPSL